MTVWTNHDRVALNEWLNTDLGQKFLANLKENRPKLIPGEFDLNKMAMMGAMYTGYEMAVTEIDKMRLVAGPKEAKPRPFVETHKD